MHGMAALAYALAVGLTFCGLAGSAIELASGRRLRLGPPFVSRGRPGRSLALTLAAGPFMLANEAIAARRAGLIGRPAFILCAAGAAVWAAATGVAVVELALLAGAPPGQPAF